MRRVDPARRIAASWLLAVLWAGLACAGSGGIEPDAAPEPIVIDGWRRAEYHGLVIYTDASEAAARRAFRRLNRFVDLVSRLVYGRPFRVEGRLEVFVFGSREEYRRFAPEFLAGHATRSDDEITTALSIEQAFEGTETLYHELVHVVLINDPERRFPSWFHEGLAVFFSTSVQRGDVLTVGGLSLGAVRQLRRKRGLSLRRLLSSPAFGQRDVALFYADAWAFVHFGLLSKVMGGRDHREEFGQFVTSVSHGEGWEPAFLAAFDAEPEEVGEEFAAHRRKLAKAKVMTLSNIPLDAAEPALVFEPVARLDIARELAQLGLDGPRPGWDSAAQLFDLVLAAGPDDREAIHGRVRVAARRGELDRAAALWGRLDEAGRQGHDARLAEADLELARARALDPQEQGAVRAVHLSLALDNYRLVLAEDPDRMSALVGLGQTLVLARHEDPAEGIASLRRAVEVSPESPSIRLDLAELLIRSDESGTAQPHLDYVLQAYPETPFARRAERLSRSLR